MATLAQIYDWFMTGKKPTQAQFWASWGSFWNKGESIPQSAVSNLAATLNAKAEKSQFDGHLVDANAHAALIAMVKAYADAKPTNYGGSINLSTPPPVLAANYYPTESGTYGSIIEDESPEGYHYEGWLLESGLPMVIDLSLGSATVTYNGVFCDVQVVGVAVDLSEYALKAEVSDKADLVQSSQLFKKETKTRGYYMGDRDGVAEENEGYDHSDFIKVDPSSPYVGSHSMRFITSFNINKVVIDIPNENKTSIITGANVEYVIPTIRHEYLDVFKFEKGTISTAGLDYYKGIDPEQLPNDLLKKSNVVNSLTSNSTEFPASANTVRFVNNKLDSKLDLEPFVQLFNKETKTRGYFMEDTNGVTQENEIYDHSDFIKVDPSSPYVGSHNMRFITSFNINKVVIDIPNENKTSIITGANVEYVIPTILHDYLEVFQFEKGDTPSTLKKYQVVIKQSQLPNNGELLNLKITQSSQLFNKETKTRGYYMGDRDGVAEENEDYDHSAFIKVDPSSPYVGSHSMRFITSFNINKVVIDIPNENKTSIITGASVEYVIPTIRHEYLDVFKFEKGDTPTLWTPCKKEVISNENLEIFLSQIIKDVDPNGDIFKLFLPKEVCVALGRTIELYNNQVSWCGNINDYHFVWSGIGKSLKRKWSCEGVSIGTNNLTLKVYNKNNILVATKTTIVRVASNVIVSPFTICPIGDSLSNSKPWYNEVKLLSGNILFTGTRYNSTHEGRSGADAAYYLGNNVYDYEMSGYDGNDGRSQTLNPFWNPATNDVDFNYYKTNYNQNPSKLLLWLGTNGMVVNPDINAGNIKTFIDKIRTTGGATIPIFVVHTLFRGNQNGIGVEEGTDGYVVTESYKLNEDLKVFNLQEKVLSDLGSYSNLYLVPVSTCHDSENNFGQVVTPVNPRATQTELFPNQATHPQLQGYEQIADIIFSSLCVNQ